MTLLVSTVLKTLNSNLHSDGEIKLYSASYIYRMRHIC